MKKLSMKFATLAAAGMLLMGCATDPAETAPIETEPAVDGEQFAFEARWLDFDSIGSYIAFISYGSSSCYPGLEPAELSAEGEITITLFEPDAERMCTMDYAPRVLLARAPEGVDRSGEVTLSVVWKDRDGKEQTVIQ